MTFTSIEPFLQILVASAFVVAGAWLCTKMAPEIEGNDAASGFFAVGVVLAISGAAIVGLDIYWLVLWGIPS